MNYRQKSVAKKVLESHGKISVSKAMLESGYPPATAKNPQAITRSKGWKELMDKYLPDDKLLEVHEQGLEATKTITSHTEPDYTMPDYATRAKYLELGYKVKGRFIENGVTIQNTGDMNLEFTYEGKTT